MMLVTVLGSCVSACIRDRKSGVGGMNHFMLPDGDGDESSPSSTSARYGGFAMELLINHLIKLGARRDNLEAKVFGGGNVMRGLTVANVGARNAEFVMRFLNLENVPVVAKDLVDIYPRKVHFFPSSGRVLVKRLRTTHNDTILEREQDYGARLRKAPSYGDVELFA
jgi:chemotaxis protein CheD